MNQHSAIDIEGNAFEFVFEIEPERDESGKFIELMPQSRYKRYGVDRLNRHGEGPFCKFRAPKNMPYSGVYALTIDGTVSYVGECADFSRRWGPTQYGSISPKNCFVGGQSTNCKINSRVLKYCSDGKSVKLWFHRTDKYKELERELLSKLNPPWNG